MKCRDAFRTGEGSGTGRFPWRKVWENRGFPSRPRWRLQTAGCQRVGILAIMKSCLNCNEDLKRWQSKYCSNKCQADYQYKSCIKEWKSNSKRGLERVATKNISAHLKRYLIETHGEKCSACGWSRRHQTTGKVPLEVDHMDGTSHNNKESNLRVVCPNCHSLTIHFRNLNRTHGRVWRLKYLQSKKAN